MGRLLGRVPVIPFYNQVSIGDHKDAAAPEWDASGHAAGYTASETHMLVATCNDQDGHVVVDVRDGQKNDRYGTVVFDGHLRIDSQTLAIGSVSAEPNRALFFPRPGTWKVVVYVDPPARTRHVTVLIEDYDDPDMPEAQWMEC